VDIWDKNSRYGPLLQEVSNLWLSLGCPSINWPEYSQGQVVLPVSVVMGYLRSWCDGVILAQRQSAPAAPDSDSKERADSGLHGAACCASGPLLASEFVVWQSILKEKGYPQTPSTRDQMIEALEALLDWAQKDALAESPQNTQLPSVEPRQRIAIIRKWITQWRDGTHEPLAGGKTLGKTSQ
jgi:hypothetical protein